MLVESKAADFSAVPGNLPMAIIGFSGSLSNVTVNATTTFYLIATNQAGTSTTSSLVVNMP